MLLNDVLRSAEFDQTKVAVRESIYKRLAQYSNSQLEEQLSYINTLTNEDKSDQYILDQELLSVIYDVLCKTVSNSDSQTLVMQIY